MTFSISRSKRGKMLLAFGSMNVVILVQWEWYGLLSFLPKMFIYYFVKFLFLLELDVNSHLDLPSLSRVHTPQRGQSGNPFVYLIKRTSFPKPLVHCGKYNTAEHRRHQCIHKTSSRAQMCDKAQNIQYY